MKKRRDRATCESRQQRGEKVVSSQTMRTRGAGLLVAALLFGISPGPMGVSLSGGEVAAQASNKTQEELDRIAADLSKVEGGALRAEIISTNFPLEERFNDASIAYELKQYDRASYLFLDVISRSEPRSFPGYRASLYYLADSLYQQRNYIGARNYLKDLTALGPGEYYQEALAKMLELAYETNNYDGIEQIYDKMANADKPALSYMRGKTLYEQGRFADARAAFLSAAQDPMFTIKGNYFAGVTLVSEKKLDEAQARFAMVVAQKPEGVGDQHIYSLAYLAMGRVAYEQEKYDEALGYYTAVERQDDAFIDAMYEAAWVYIQLGNFQQANVMIDLLIMAEPDVDTYTKAMLLGADLAQRNKEYEKALQKYEILLEKYGPVRDQMYAFVAEHEDLEGFFQTLVQDDLSLRVPEGLPNVKTDFRVMSPEEWLTEDGQLARTQQIIDDVAATRANLRTAYEDLAQIKARLSSGARLKSFPGLATQVVQVVELESRLIKVQDELVSQQARLVAPQLSGADAATWKTMSEELAVLKSRYQDVPRDVEELRAREKSVSMDFQRLRERLSETGESIDGLRAELAAVDTYVQTQDVILSEEERQKVNQMRQELRDAVKQLEEEQQALRGEIEVMRESASGGDTIADEERAMRARYQERLAQAATFLQKHRSVASDPSALAQLERMRGQIPALSARIQGYYQKMDGVVLARTEEVQGTVANLERSLNEEQAALDTTIDTSRQVAGALAYRTFVTRARQFDEVVLRADVGKIDVLFTQKESTSGEINELYQKRTDELRELQEAFDELR